jgi:RNA polymerase sigma-70 factor (ECF subfamily)
MRTDDDRLIAAAKTGDEEALVALLKKYAAQLRRRLGGRIAQQWVSYFDEDDLLQITFMEAFQRIHRFSPRGHESFLAWLWQIAEYNLRDAIKALERQKRPRPGMRVHNPRDNESSAPMELFGVTSSTPSRYAAIDEAKAILEEAIKKLPSDYGLVVRIMDIQGKTAAQAAAAMRRSEGAVHMLRARAHDRLREALGCESSYFSKTGTPQ